MGFRYGEWKPKIKYWVKRIIKRPEKIPKTEAVQTSLSITREVVIAENHGI